MLQAGVMSPHSGQSFSSFFLGTRAALPVALLLCSCSGGFEGQKLHDDSDRVNADDESVGAQGSGIGASAAGSGDVSGAGATSGDTGTGTVLVPFEPDATTASSPSAQAEHPAEHALDGDETTYWAAESGSGEDGKSLTFDLQASFPVNGVEILFLNGGERTFDFEIWVGDDPDSLSKVYEGASSLESGYQTFEFSGGQGRYVQFVGFGNSENAWNSIVEFRASVLGAGTAPSGSGGTPAAGTGGTTGGSTGGTNSGAAHASDIISNLDEWKITLPVDDENEDCSGVTYSTCKELDAKEISARDLLGYEFTPYFQVVSGEVFFRAHAAGATTSGSDYPRSELRQLINGDSSTWSFDSNQSLTTDLRVTHVPVEKPEVSMVQIHGAGSYEPLRVQYHADVGVYIVWNEDENTSDEALGYSLGQRLRVTVNAGPQVSGGNVYVNIENLDTGGSFNHTWTSGVDDGYFKVGCYTQSSIFLSDIKGDSFSDEPLTAYGEVAVSSLAWEQN